ncbi:MAG: MATE family efflux transporter, partial [Myxococcota bacterium]|nr:MATE family efflux transporter [Myxococcota bacterium]
MSAPPNPKMRVFLNALWSLSGFIITTAIMFAAVRIYISYLGLASYGVFTLAMSVLGIAGVFNLGLGDATTKFVAQYHSQDRPDRVTMVVAATAIIYLCIGLVGTTLLVLSAPLIAHYVLRLEGLHLVEATQSLAIVGYGFFPLIAQTVFLGYFDGLQRYRV